MAKKTPAAKPASEPLANVPKVLQQVLRSHFNRPHNYATVTVTGLNQEPRALALGQIGYQRMKLPQRIADGCLALIGSAVHEFMERRLRTKAFEEEKQDSEPRFMVEHQMTLPIPNMPPGMEHATLGGTFDLYELAESPRTLYDFKIVNCFKLGKASADYCLQMNAYRVMLKQQGFPEPERLCLIQFGRDWSDPGKGGKSSQDFPLVVEEVPIDVSIDYARLMQLARERAVHVLRMRQALDAAALAKTTQGKQGDAEAVQKWLAQTPACADDYVRQWGVLPGGVPRRCMYCNARNVCDRVGGTL